jgi:PAS domain S-box-containing protein
VTVANDLPTTLAGRWIAGAGLFFIAAMAGLSAYDIVRSQREAVAEIGRDLQSQARVTAEQTSRSLQAVDVVLRNVVAENRSTDLRSKPADQLHEYLKNQALGLVQAEGLALFDARADRYASSAVALLPLPLVNFAADPVYQLLRDAPRSTPVLATVRPGALATGNWFMPVVRRLETADGRFAGVAAASVRVAYFQDFFQEIGPGADTAITVVHDDGRLVARHPAAESELGRPWTAFAALQAAWAGRTLVTARAADPSDGRDQFGVRAAVPDYPLSIVITRDAERALAPWRERTRGTVLRTGTLVVVALALLALLQRQLRRLVATRVSLELSRERFALAAAGSEEGIWDWNLRTDEMYGSPRAREIFGLAPGPDHVRLAEWLAQVQVHPDDNETRRADLEAHIAGRTPVYACEYRVRSGDGPWRWVRVRGLCERDATGQALRMAGSVTDVDAHRRASDELRQSEERYALAMTGLTGGHWVWDVQSDALFVSGSLNRLFALPADCEVQTRRAYFAHIAVHPDDLATLQQIDDDVTSGRAPRIDYEYRIVVPGEPAPRWILTRAQAFPGPDRRPLRVAGVSVDITARKATEEALRRSEERYQLAVAGSDQGLWDWDLASDQLFLSPRAQQLFWPEVGEPQRPRRHWIALTPYHPDDIAPVRRAIADYLQGRTRGFSVEYRVRHHGGAWRWYRQRGIAVRDAAARATRMAGSIEDITERKNADTERDRLETQLRQAQKLEAIGTLAGGIAHDFNNILAAILGYGEMALKDAPEGSAQRRHIDAAVSAGLRAKSLVERILAFSRSGIGERVPVHVQSVVQEALDQLQASTPAGLAIERRLDGGDAAVLGDPTQVHQVVMNLCANAVQAMRSQGKMVVSLDRVSDTGPGCITGPLPAGEYVRLQVIDSGMGIAPQVLERIFDPFFTTKSVGVGTGLGLSLVHGIVTDLGGGIDVQSEPGVGSTFTVFLPWQSNIAPPAREVTAVPAGRGETVLLVDDEEALVRLGEELVAELGYEPVGYTSSRAALEAYRADPARFDVVLSDETMPELTGSEMAMAVRQLRSDLPIVLMSGLVTPALTQRAREAGVTEVLAKPLVARDIARALAAALGRT